MVISENNAWIFPASDFTEGAKRAGQILLLEKLPGGRGFFDPKSGYWEATPIKLEEAIQLVKKNESNGVCKSFLLTRERRKRGKSSKVPPT
ncbi:MAG: hypothetical protein ABIG40_02165 [Parcubacteria group bacterium]